MKLVVRKRFLTGAIDDLAGCIITPQVFNSAKKLIKRDTPDVGHPDRSVDLFE
jgi:hypothetical protein